MRTGWSLALTFVAACGSSHGARPSPPVAAAPPDAAPAPSDATAVDCEDSCTQYAICYEEFYKRDYHGGGSCVDDCQQMEPGDQREYAARITAAAGDCAALFGED